MCRLKGGGCGAEDAPQGGDGRYARGALAAFLQREAGGGNKAGPSARPYRECRDDAAIRESLCFQPPPFPGPWRGSGSGGVDGALHTARRDYGVILPERPPTTCGFRRMTVITTLEP